MNLKTKTRIRRLHWKAMVTTELIVDVLNFFDEKPASETTTEPQVEPVVNSVEADARQRPDAQRRALTGA